jgi:predicted alpha/beta hydrolase family esterase
VAARGWWAVLLVQCLFGLWMAALWLPPGLSTAGGTSIAVALLVVAGVVAAVQLLFTAIGMLLAARARAATGNAPGLRPDVTASSSRAGAWQAWLSEAVHFAAMEWLMALEPWLTRRWDAPDVGPRPVLLVHGILCNRGIWWRLRRRLLAQGYGPLVAVNLPRPAAAIDAQVATVEQALERAQALAPGAPVLIIAHSMGGLVIRALLEGRRLAGVARVVTVGTPHHGSALARLCPSGGCRDLRPGSGWLRAHETSLRTMPVPAASIYSLDDNLIGPRTSAHWPAARNVSLRGVGHFGLLATASGIAALLAEVGAPP